MKKITVPDVVLAAVQPGSWVLTIIWYKFLEAVANRLNLQDVGWTASTGIANKGAYAVYAGTAISNPPTQVEVQAVDAALVAVSQRMKAIEDALRTGGDIN